MHDRHDLTDAEWEQLEPLLPDRVPRRGGRWCDHRPVINGVLWRTRTGSPWRDLPLSYGNWKTVYSRRRRWSGDGTWEAILDGLRAGCDRDEGSPWTVAVDATEVGGHQHAAGARPAPPKDIPVQRLAPLLPDPKPAPEPAAEPEPSRSQSRRLRRTPPTTQGAGSNDKNPALAKRADREGLGRSRGGLSTKIHLLADSRCRPLARVTTAGQRHDSLAFQPLRGRLRIRRLERGRPEPDPGGRWPTRRTPTARFTPTCGSAGSRRRSPRRPTSSRPAPPRAPTVDGHRRLTPRPYKQRNTVERTHNKLKAFRAVALRTDKREFVFHGTIDVASIKIWLRHPAKQDPADTT